MSLDPVKIGAVIQKGIEEFEPASHISEAGRVLEVGDGIARVSGLRGAMSGELLSFENGVVGIAMNLEQNNIGVVLLGSDIGIAEGDLVKRTKRVAQVPVGDAVQGRVVNALGQPIDQKGLIMTMNFRPVERIAPGVIARSPVNEPLETGIKAIDSMVPIGKGQRQLIIGDRQTGKTALAVDAILNQKDKDVHCVYVAIGQKTSTLADIVNTLTEEGAMHYTTIVSASAADTAPLQYIAPYAGCAIAEEWMEQGKDVLIVYDDLSKHAVAYRTMSLLLRRPPGREAYPGDVFYLHSRLLERAGKLSEEYGGGSMTALPIIETQAGDMSAYIPTNVISITDGQIYLETELFHAGVRPAINPGLSVSRVGGSAQVGAMKKLAAPLRTQLAQYRELSAFSQFSSDLDADTRARLSHGERIVEVLKQPQYSPLTMEQQILILHAMEQGSFADIKVEDMVDFEATVHQHFTNWHGEVLKEIKVSDSISPELSDTILTLFEEIKAEFKA